jgi:hypothetical protein
MYCLIVGTEKVAENVDFDKLQDMADENMEGSVVLLSDWYTMQGLRENVSLAMNLVGGAK